MDFFLALRLIQLVTFVATCVLIYYIRPKCWDRRTTLWVGGIWVLVASAEFWVLGPYSFSYFGNELEFAPAHYLYLNNFHAGGPYTPAFLGGTDIYGMSATGGQYISLERELLLFLPLWFVNALHKIGCIWLAYAGMYRIARRLAPNSGRVAAAAISCVYSLSNILFVDITWFAGWGYNLMPWIVYLMVLRIDRRFYWSGVFAVSGLFAVSSDPVHVLLPALLASLFAAVLVDWRRLSTLFVASGILVFLVVLNWHEVLYGLASLAPLSGRVESGTSDLTNLFQEAGSLLGSFDSNPVVGIIGLTALGSLLIVNRRRALLPIGVGTAALLIGPALVVVPWSDIGLSWLGAINFRYLADVVPLVAATIMIVTMNELSRNQTASSVKTGQPLGIRALTVFLFALGISQLAWYKAHNLSVFLEKGSIASLGQFADRLPENWSPDEHMRTVSLPYRMASNFAISAGMEAFDGFVNLSLKSVKVYWRAGINNPKRLVLKEQAFSGSNNIGLVGIDINPKCCRKYDVDKHINMNLLRVAGVGYMLSVLPLEGKGLRLVGDSAHDQSVPPRSTEPFFQRIKGYIKLIFSPSKIRAYAIDDILPRAFGARGVEIISDDVPASMRLDLISKVALDRKVVISKSQTPVFEPANLALIVNQIVHRDDGIRVSVSSPDKGVLIINNPYLPFWRIYIDGKAVQAPIPVNDIQMAVIVPKGERVIELKYERRLLRQIVHTYLIEFFGISNLPEHNSAL